MIKGGYTSFDLSSAFGSEDPVTIAGIYQKCKDTIGKPAIVTYGTYGERAWGWIMAADGNYVILTEIFSEGAFYPAYATITNEDAVTVTIVTPDEG